MALSFNAMEKEKKEMPKNGLNSRTSALALALVCVFILSLILKSSCSLFHSSALNNLMDKPHYTIVPTDKRFF